VGVGFGFEEDALAEGNQNDFCFGDDLDEVDGFDEELDLGTVLDGLADDRIEGAGLDVEDFSEEDNRSPKTLSTKKTTMISVLTTTLT